MSNELLSILLKKLDYTNKTGWLHHSEFKSAMTHRFHMEQAHKEMYVDGAYCLQGDVHATVVPLVYVAIAENFNSVQEIHRKVWSQGLVPFLLIVCPDEVVLCSGFRYTHETWENSVHRFDKEVIKNLPDAQDPIHFQAVNGSEIWDMRALHLRTSLFWRDHAIDVEGRVDRKLLENLDILSHALITGSGVSRGISPSAANGLIGRFLYVLFLVDRGIVDQKWVDGRGHKEITLNDQFANWPESATWRFLDDIDSIFNGSIFPLKQERNEIDQSHINLVRRVMKYGAQLNSVGSIQFSFIDCYFGAIRTETLSSVYERFLENNQAGERRKMGAFYTPSYLVDFMLDRVEEQLVLEDGTPVLDPSAGSGVFLVGAFRRMLERAYLKNNGIELSKVKDILRQNIFGIEKNIDACHVAAFSLYLTMLDYINPRDLSRIAAGMDTEKLFPSLVGVNIFPHDFFNGNKSFKTLPAKVECIIGNPPWQSISKLGSKAAEDWHGNYRELPIGNNQAAELFIWKALKEHLNNDGILGMLIPAKSFINPTSLHFRQSLASNYKIVGTANFGHLRHRLFASAKHAAIGVIVRNSLPQLSDMVWIYSPLSVGQPIARKEWPWTIIIDRSEVSHFRYSRLLKNPRAWFEAFMLRPIDRQIHRFIEDLVDKKTYSRLGDLCANLGAAIARGGNNIETGVDVQFIRNAPVRDRDLLLTNKQSLLFDQSRSVQNSGSDKTLLPTAQIAKIKPSYRNKFGGNVLLVPRNFLKICFEKNPIAYSSSVMGVYFDKPAKALEDKEINFLKALDKYLNSKTCLYFVATTGRRWMMDRSNIEPNDLAMLPVPFKGLEDENINKILELSGKDLESTIRNIFGIEGVLAQAIDEFLDFRIDYQDGDVPKKAFKKPSEPEIGKYAKIVNYYLNGLLGKKDAFNIGYKVNNDIGVASIAVSLKDAEIPNVSLDTLCEKAIQDYKSSQSNSFIESLQIQHKDKASATLTFIKSLEFFRWTIDSAYADSQKLMQSLLEESLE